MRLFSCKIWPNGEFSIGLYCSGRLAVSFLARKVPKPGRWYKWDPEQVERQNKAVAAIAERNSTGDSTPVLGPSSPLGSSSLPKSRRPRGSSGLTGFGARMVRNACHLMEEKHGRRNMSFLTLTIPDVNEENLKKILVNWSEICKDVIEALKRRLIRQGLPGEIVYVTEFQEKRQDSYGSTLPFPHLHLVFNGRRNHKAPWGLSPFDCREVWRNALTSVGVEAGFWDAVENIRTPRMPVGAYLGKYISKGHRSYKHRSDTESNFIRAWWGCSFSLRRRIKRGIQSTDSSAIEFVFRRGNELREDGMIHYFRYVYVTMRDGIEKCVGATGRMTSNLRSMLCQTHEEESRKRTRQSVRPLNNSSLRSAKLREVSTSKWGKLQYCKN